MFKWTTKYLKPVGRYLWAMAYMLKLTRDFRNSRVLSLTPVNVSFLFFFNLLLCFSLATAHPYSLSRHRCLILETAQTPSTWGSTHTSSCCAARCSATPHQHGRTSPCQPPPLTPLDKNTLQHQLGWRGKEKMPCGLRCFFKPHVSAVRCSCQTHVLSGATGLQGRSDQGLSSTSPPPHFIHLPLWLPWVEADLQKCIHAWFEAVKRWQPECLLQQLPRAVHHCVFGAGLSLALGACFPPLNWEGLRLPIMSVCELSSGHLPMLLGTNWTF